MAAVKFPGFGARSQEMLWDIAVLIGSQVMSEDMDIKLERAVAQIILKLFLESYTYELGAGQGNIFFGKTRC